MSQQSDILSTLAEKGRPHLMNRDKEMVPVVLLRAMLILALSALAITTYAVVTERPLVGQPLPAPVTAEREIVMDGDKSGAVSIYGADGTLLAAAEDGVSGFHSVIWRAMARSRRMQGVDPTLPLTLARHANGRLSLTDPITGWTVELASFGAANRDAFGAFLD